MEQIEGQEDDNDCLLFNNLMLLFTGIAIYSTVIISITKHISIDTVDEVLLPILMPVLCAMFVITLIPCVVHAR